MSRGRCRHLAYCRHRRGELQLRVWRDTLCSLASVESGRTINICARDICSGKLSLARDYLGRLWDRPPGKVRSRKTISHAKFSKDV